MAKKRSSGKKQRGRGLPPPRGRFVHREISWLAFNERVLEEAVDPHNPLAEQVKYLAIFASNLDEFFMVRVAGIRRLMEARFNKRDPYGYYPDEIYEQIGEKVDELTVKHYAVFREVHDKLRDHGIEIRQVKDLNNEQKKYVKNYFNSAVFPVVTPMAVDQGHPFPNLPSNTLSLALHLSKKGKKHFAILPVPSNLPRLIELPSRRGAFHAILLEEIIRNKLRVFFRGYKIVKSGLFRLLRDSDFVMEEEYADDLLQAIEEEIRKRPHANIVRLEIETGLNRELVSTLCQELECEETAAAVIDGVLDLSFLFDISSAVPKQTLQFPSFTGSSIRCSDIFKRVRKGDLILHRPFQSFSPVIDFISQAASDPSVLAIKMTLYRTSAGSSFIKALKEAAWNGKQVTILVELKARFDEEKNIGWARELEEAGCHVIYGIPGVKIHSKIAMVVRREEDGIQRYIHLSTGNYNEITAEQYTDIGFFTADEDMARDISDAFNVISGYSVPGRWKNVITAPYDLRKYFFQLIDTEIAHQKEHGTGLIFAKMNSLQDTRIIDKLYEASSAGVTVKLIVRGICSLIPGVEGLSEQIEVRSVVGRFLEHSRIFLFSNNNSPRIFLSSADWMTRNFDRRVELLFALEDEKIREHLTWLLDLYWQDNVKARKMQPDSVYTYISRDPDEPLNTQEYLISYYARK